jgi:hypothetical protein
MSTVQRGDASALVMAASIELPVFQHSLSFSLIYI